MAPNIRPIYEFQINRISQLETMEIEYLLLHTIGSMLANRTNFLTKRQRFTHAIKYING